MGKKTLSIGGHFGHDLVVFGAHVSTSAIIVVHSSKIDHSLLNEFWTTMDELVARIRALDDNVRITTLDMPIADTY